MGFSRGHQGRQGHRPHDDDDDEEDDDEVEDNDKDNNNNKDDNDDKGISALGLDRDLGFWRGHQGHRSRLSPELYFILYLNGFNRNRNKMNIRC